MKKLLYIFLGLTIWSCDSDNENNKSPDEMITESGLTDHIKTLASDEFLGRKPFSEGETKTVNYLKTQFESLGLEPGNGDSYFQEVPLVEIDAKVTGNLEITGSGLDLEFKKDYVALTRRVTETIDVKDSELIFVGFGTVAPEYDWNDYEGLDVSGKTVVVLVNDPGFGSEDKTFFKGGEMTYYGRWTYKYEEAARQGAEGILIVHDTKPASYPWGVVENGWTGSQLYLQTEDNNMGRCAIEGWITKDVANSLFEKAGYSDYDFTAAARSRDFKPFSLNMSANITLSNTYKSSTSQNVAALYKGKTDEVIIYSAHWDHMGVGSVVNGDSIWNGAVDNATGTACLLEIAKAFQQLSEKPNRSILFLAVTAEEQGLLGSAHYGENPIFPPENTVANINMDALLPFGKMKDLVVIGYGQSEMDDLATKIAAEQGRVIVPDQNPGAGSFFRSDHFNFAKIGIPALYADGGIDHFEKGAEWGREQSADYTANRYHKAADEYNDNWDMSGMVEDAKFFFNVGYTLSKSTEWPNWKEGSEFKAIREASRN